MDAFAFARSWVDNELRSFSPSLGFHPQLLEALQYIFLGAGKALRPALVFHTYNSFGGPLPPELWVRRWGVAVELIHTYSLIHDDLPCMDNDDFRRGKPTLHKVYDEAKALLAGDALLTLAFEFLALSAKDSKASVAEAVGRLSRAAGGAGMVSGQWRDMDKEKDFLRIHREKTGALMGVSMALGGLAAGRSSQVCDELQALGEDIGILFQIEDDLLDVTGSTAVLGKSAGKDAAQGKSSTVSNLGIEETLKLKTQWMTQIETRLRSFPELGSSRALLNRFGRRSQ